LFFIVAKWNSGYISIRVVVARTDLLKLEIILYVEFHTLAFDFPDP